MDKKVKKTTIVIIMLFLVFLVAACDNISLADYKDTKSQALQDYVDDRGVENYNSNGWEEVRKAVTDGKKAIANVTTKSAVTTAYNESMNIVDAIQEEEVKMLYTLQEAVDNDC